MANKNNCDCITLQPHDSPPISVCSDDVGELIVGTLAAALLIVVAKELLK